MTATGTMRRVRSPYSDLPQESFVTYARIQKAIKVAGYLLAKGYSGEDVLVFSDRDKELVRAEVGVHELSDESWGVVALLVRDGIREGLRGDK